VVRGVGAVQAIGADPGEQPRVAGVELGPPLGLQVGHRAHRLLDRAGEIAVGGGEVGARDRLVWADHLGHRGAELGGSPRSSASQPSWYAHCPTKPAASRAWFAAARRHSSRVRAAAAVGLASNPERL
jgi:hypothetical protein